MYTSHLVRALALIACLPLASAACGGASFEPASKIEGLRVLALQKEPAYAKPGETVDFKLLYWDAKSTDASPRNIEFDFFSCENPPGDLYYACQHPNFLGSFTRSGNRAAGGMPGENDGSFALDASFADASTGDEGSDGPPAESDAAPSFPDAMSSPDAMSFPDSMSPGEGGTAPASGVDPLVSSSVTVGSDIIRPKAPGVTPYGLDFILFAACAGHLVPALPTTPNGPPFECQDDHGKPLGPDDFVPGYSSIYVYDGLRNANPILTGFSFRDGSFQDSAAAPDSDVPHVARCTESDRGKCPTFDVKIGVDRASAEVDPLAKDANGGPLEEQLWVAYLATGGDFTTSLRLVNDASQGWNDDNGTKYRAPATPGTIRIFAVVHDNRGGVAWAQGKVVVD
jgi:hypothetical protein